MARPGLWIVEPVPRRVQLAINKPLSLKLFDLCGWILTLIVGWVERQKNGGFRCFNLILLNSHGMQIMWN